jgi:hypothetical protein
MNCFYHPETPAAAFCRSCGKPLCASCQQPAMGTVFCPEHLPAPQQFQVASPVAPSPYTAPATQVVQSSVSPGLAFMLGLIPGVGAIYNAQYAKGVVHVIIFGLLISITNSDAARGLEPLFGMLIAIWYFYMAFEAYHTASKRQLGQAPDEFSSIFPLKARKGGFPIGPVVLIALGVLFLLHTLGLIEMHQILRYWPVALIALGGYMLYCRLTGCDVPEEAGQEASHEQ